MHLNVTSEAHWSAAVDVAVHTYGKLDILVNNAGIVVRKDLESTTVDDWDQVMAVNAKGVFLGTKVAIPAMRQAGGGSIREHPFRGWHCPQPGDASVLRCDQGCGAYLR